MTSVPLPKKPVVNKGHSKVAGILIWYYIQFFPNISYIYRKFFIYDENKTYHILCTHSIYIYILYIYLHPCIPIRKYSHLGNSSKQNICFTTCRVRVSSFQRAMRICVPGTEHVSTWQAFIAISQPQQMSEFMSGNKSDNMYCDILQMAAKVPE